MVLKYGSGIGYQVKYWMIKVRESYRKHHKKKRFKVGSRRKSRFILLESPPCYRHRRTEKGSVGVIRKIISVTGILNLQTPGVLSNQHSHQAPPKSWLAMVKHIFFKIVQKIVSKIYISFLQTDRIAADLNYLAAVSEAESNEAVS